MKETKKAKNSWDNWTIKNQKRITVGKMDYLIQSINGSEYDEVKNIPNPVPPMKIKYGPDGKPIIRGARAEQELDYEAESYKKDIKNTDIKRALMILEFGLLEPDGKDIPGKTDMEKWDFLRQGTAGAIESVTLEILRVSSLLPEEVDELKEN